MSQYHSKEDQPQGGWARQEVNVRDLGAVGDGEKDDYDAIVKSIEVLTSQGGGRLVFPTGVYRIARHRVDSKTVPNHGTSLSIVNGRNIVIDGRNSKLTMDGLWTRTRDYRVGALSGSFHNAIGLSLNHCDNVVVKDLELDGNAHLTKREAEVEGVSHGISLLGCRNVVIANVVVRRFHADGLYVGAAREGRRESICRDVLVSNSRFLNNARQGCSITGLRGAFFLNCEFSRAGDAGAYGGHAPQAGVDIEPNGHPGQASGIVRDDFTGDIGFMGCRFVDNGGFEFVSSGAESTRYPIYISGCLFENTLRQGAKVVPASKSTVLYHCQFSEVGLWPSYGARHASGVSTEAHACSFVSRDRAQPVVFHTNPMTTLLVRGCTMRLAAPRAASRSYRIRGQGAPLEWRDNAIVIDASEHLGGGEDHIAMLEGAEDVSGNRWITDLDDGARRFVVSYSGTRSVEQEQYVPARSWRAVGPGTAAASDSSSVEAQRTEVSPTGAQKELSGLLDRLRAAHVWPP